MNGKQLASPVSFMAFVSRLPQKGMQVRIVADQGQKQALAEAHGLLAVERFEAELQISSWKRNGVKVSGRVVADITQECVVTLEPVEATIREDVQGLFLPGDSKLGRLGFDEGGEIHLDAEGPDSPETFSGDSIDVGALAEEFFGLGINPYPKKTGVGLPSAPDEQASDTPEGPLQEKLRQLLRNG